MARREQLVQLRQVRRGALGHQRLGLVALLAHVGGRVRALQNVDDVAAALLQLAQPRADLLQKSFIQMQSNSRRATPARR